MIYLAECGRRYSWPRHRVACGLCGRRIRCVDVVDIDGMALLVGTICGARFREALAMIS